MKKSLITLLSVLIILIPRGVDRGLFLGNWQIDERIRKVKVEGVSNCFGTALYLLGEQKTDEYSSSGDIEDRTKVFYEIKRPTSGCLAVWDYEDKLLPKVSIKGINFNNDYVIHSGIVTCANPVLITHRKGAEGEFKVNEPIEKVDKIYGRKVKFYIPAPDSD